MKEKKQSAMHTRHKLILPFTHLGRHNSFIKSKEKQNKTKLPKVPNAHPHVSHCLCSHLLFFFYSPSHIFTISHKQSSYNLSSCPNSSFTYLLQFQMQLSQILTNISVQNPHKPICSSSLLTYLSQVITYCSTS